MMPEAPPVLSPIQLSTRHRNFQLLSWSSFLCLWHHQAQWADSDMPGTGPKEYQEKFTFTLFLFFLHQLKNPTGHKILTLRPSSQPKAESLTILYYLNRFDLGFFFPHKVALFADIQQCIRELTES